jgi:small-conductance mechanosensitive channel
VCWHTVPVERLRELFGVVVVSQPTVIVGLLVGGWLITRLTRVVVRRVVRRLAERSARRFRGETAEMGEQRRRQRVDAAAHMLHHLIALVVWIGVTIALFQILDLDAAFFLSSAGFIGAGLAIGGQHKVNDYLTGLSVLLEDRYGVGDEIVAHVPNWAEPVHGVVEAIGLVSTRVRDHRGTLHLPHGSLNGLRNLSQEPAEARLAVTVPDGVDAATTAQAVADTMRELAGTKHLTGVLFVDDIKAAATDGEHVEVEVRTARPLDAEERALLVRRTEQRLSDRT